MYERGDSEDAARGHLQAPMGSRRINELMTPLRDGLARGLCALDHGDARFLTTTTGDALVAAHVQRPPLDGARGDAWSGGGDRKSPRASASRSCGRSRGIKLVVGGETVTEVLQVPWAGRVYVRGRSRARSRSRTPRCARRC